MKTRILLENTTKIDCLHLDEILKDNNETIIKSSKEIQEIVDHLESVDEIYLMGELSEYGRWRIAKDCNNMFYLIERRY